MDRCIFCQIHTGRAPASFVHECDDFMAFMDIHPMRPGHVLVLPRRHRQHLHELPQQMRARLFELGLAIGNAQRRLGADAVNYVINDGRAANQTVAHLHLHVVPRRRGDTSRLIGRMLRKPLEPLLGPASRERLNQQAHELRATLKKEAGKRESGKVGRH